VRTPKIGHSVEIIVPKGKPKLRFMLLLTLHHQLLTIHYAIGALDHGNKPNAANA
jgi:hypothetical protein